MSLKPFTYPFPETRFLHAGSAVYKFKIRYGDSIRGEEIEIENKEAIIQELELEALLWQLAQRKFPEDYCLQGSGKLHPNHRLLFDVQETQLKENEPCMWNTVRGLRLTAMKFEITAHYRCRGQFSGVLPFELYLIGQDSIRAVLANMDSLQPFVTEHFIVFPYKSKWERVSHLKFKHGDIVLAPYPFVFTLYVEMKWLSDNWSPGKRTSDIPLEKVPSQLSTRDQILAEHKAEEATMKKQKLMEESSSPRRPGPHRAKMETSSQASSSKKAHIKTRKNREREAQQEYQDITASDATKAQEQGSKWGHSLPGPVVPPLQQSNLSPRELGISGFFGFLSSLFPFRYFFGKSSQRTSQAQHTTTEEGGSSLQ